MLELLGLFGGGLFRLLPSVLDFFHKKQELAHELALLDKQMELDRMHADQKLAEIAAQSEGRTEGAWSDALAEAIRGQAAPTGIRWVDALSASVRPVLTYWWAIGLYTTYKSITIYLALLSNAGLVVVAGLLVTEFDRAVIGSVISFWFVDRALRKMTR